MGWFENIVGGLLPGTFQTDADFQAKNARGSLGQQQQNAYNLATQLQQQYQQTRGQADEAFGQARQFGQQAGGQFGQLGGFGQQDRGAYLSALQNLLPMFAGYAGLPSGAGASPYAQAAGGGGAPPPPMQRAPVDSDLQYMIDQAAGRGQQALPGYPASPGAFSPTGTGPQGAPNTNAGRSAHMPPQSIPVDANNQSLVPTAQPPGVNNPDTQGQAPPTPGSPDNLQGFDPYALSPGQHTQLNAQIDQHRNSEASALADYRASYAKRGMIPPPEGEALIREHFGAQSEQTKANFHEQARQAGQGAVQNLLGMFNPLGAQGANEVGAAGAGYAGLGGLYGNIGSQYGSIGQGELGASLGQNQLGMNAQLGINDINNQQAARFQQGWGDIAGLGGYLAGMSMGKPKVPGVPGAPGGGSAGTPPFAGGTGTVAGNAGAQVGIPPSGPPKPFLPTIPPSSTYKPPF